MPRRTPVVGLRVAAVSLHRPASKATSAFRTLLSIGVEHAFSSRNGAYEELTSSVLRSRAYTHVNVALTPGTRLGIYEIAEQIGAGGMGEVYRATDTNLKRSVAIKALPASVAGDADRLARFRREAEVLAALNHPNIAAIYGFEKTSDVTALVMELVEGEDLSQRIARSAIPLDETLPIAKQIADALEAAHEQNIIHRDLKPANIKVRADGTVKVLDFGLAKAMEPATGSSPSMSMSPTITTPAMTQAGVILGTAAYMSPDRARRIAVVGCRAVGPRCRAGGGARRVVCGRESEHHSRRAAPPLRLRTSLEVRAELGRFQRGDLAGWHAHRLQLPPRQHGQHMCAGARQPDRA